jgi:uncharacterized protein
MKGFSQSVCENIGYYVYFLKDPRNSNIFYVGKGKGNRVFQHIRGAVTMPTQSDKLDLIREIGAQNVQHFILRHGLTEEQALEVESACIDLLGLDSLFNKMKGFYCLERGIKTIDEISQLYDAKVITIVEPAIIININKLYKRFMNEKELYDVTRSSWIVGKRRNKVKYAIAAYRGLVREVYKIADWNAVGNRWEFNGQIAESSVRDKYLNQSLDNYIKKGSRNPIKYTSMLIKQSGKCEKCGRDFSQYDTVQSTEIECDTCKKRKNLCSICKVERCECGGTYKNVFDKFPNILH